MKTIKVLLSLIAIYLALSQVLAYYDRYTRRTVLAIVTRELPLGASLSDMKAFLERHTSRFALDDTFNHAYGGFLPQTRLDKDLFDRQVQINLHFDDAHRFRNAEVNVYYTFL